MALSVDTRKVIKAFVVPWERGEFGVAWETRDRSGADRIGTKKQAQAIVDDIMSRRGEKALESAVGRGRG